MGYMIWVILYGRAFKLYTNVICLFDSLHWLLEMTKIWIWKTSILYEFIQISSKTGGYSLYHMVYIVCLTRRKSEFKFRFELDHLSKIIFQSRFYHLLIAIIHETSWSAFFKGFYLTAFIHDPVTNKILIILNSYGKFRAQFGTRKIGI